MLYGDGAILVRREREYIRGGGGGALRAGDEQAEKKR